MKAPPLEARRVLGPDFEAGLIYDFRKLEQMQSAPPPVRPHQEKDLTTPIGYLTWLGLEKEGVHVLVNLVLGPSNKNGQRVVTTDLVTLKAIVAGTFPATSMKKVPLGRILAYAQTVYLDKTQGGPVGDPGRVGRVMGDIDESSLEVAQTVADGRMGRPREITDEFLRDVANVSLRLQAKRSPSEPISLRQAVADHYIAVGTPSAQRRSQPHQHVSELTVRNWWKLARRKRFLGPTTRGARTLTAGDRLSHKGKQ